MMRTVQMNGGSSNTSQFVHTLQPMSFADLMQGLLSKRHFDRDRSLQQIRRSVSTWDENQVFQLQQDLLRVMNQHDSWEQAHGAIRAAQVILHERSLNKQANVDVTFSEQALEMCINLIEHSEARIREATSLLIGTLAHILGIAVWQKMAPCLLQRIEDNFELDETQRLLEAARIAGRDLDQAAADAKLHGLQMVHETEGWRGLETMLLAMSDLLKGCGTEMLLPVVETGDICQIEGLSLLVSYIIRAKDHPNRFVREAGLRVLESFALSGANANPGKPSVIVATLSKSCIMVVMEGLQDNWSQVRFAASIAIRTILNAINVDQKRSMYPDLLPRMCLNRHYVAEGVRVFSQETWRSVISEDGKVYLIKHMDKCISYYESQCIADNHAVREAACQGFGEIAIRLDNDKIRVFVPRIIDALEVCFQDESWPVRDHACRALADVISRFPTEVKHTGKLADLYDLYDAHLADNIASVRKNCAEAIVKASCVFPADDNAFGMKKLLERCEELMKKIDEQPERSFNGTSRARDRDSGYGSASKVARDNDIDLHTGQVMYSCGSLAPKLRRGGGCMDHGFSREKEAWEEADGGALLWGRIVECGAGDGQLGSAALGTFVETLEAGFTKKFGHEDQLLETMLTTLSQVADAIAKGYWTRELMPKLVRVLEGCQKWPSARVVDAAAVAIRCTRRAVGFTEYVAARDC